MMVCLTVPQLPCDRPYKGEATWCLARGNPGVSVGIEESDMMHCKFITLLDLRHLVPALRPLVSSTHSRNCPLSTTQNRIVQLEKTYNNHVVQLPKQACQQAICSVD